MKKNVKGFTLTEMIVVIAIIGILAAVLIPSVVIYVQRAQRSNDEQLAASMTDEIERYCIEHDIEQDDLLGTDIRTILAFKQYDLNPSRNKWTYVYDAQARTVSVTDVAAIIVDRSHEFIDPSNYREGFFLLGTGDSEVEQVVSTLCRLSSLAVYNTADELAKDPSIQALVDYFDPEDTLYISNSKVYAKKNSTEFDKVVFTEKTVHIPNFVGSNLYGAPSYNIECPNTSAIIKTIEAESELGNLFYGLKAMDNKSVLALDGQFTQNLTDIFEDENLDIKSMPSFRLGDSIEVATTATFDLIPVEKFDKNGETIIVYRFTVSYYNENGLFARGVTQYAFPA